MLGSPRQSRTRRVPLLLAAAALAGCDGIQSALEPNSEAARAVARLYWVMTGIATLVCVVVVALLLYALFRRRDFRGREPPLRLTPRSEEEARERRRKIEAGEAEPTLSDDRPLPVRLHTEREDRAALRWILIGGAAIPAVILAGVFLYTLGVMRITHASRPAELTIEVIGWQWWWEVHYLDPEGRRLFETANEIHVPVGKRVRFVLRSADVIHSFWVPQLGGKLDMIPGRTNRYVLQADEAGVYRGQCAEYCEEQHAKMSLLVVAQPEEEFRAWMAHQARGEAEITDPLAAVGREVFLGTACRACHAVRGTPAVGNLGPDLTHVASRRTLAAVTIPNTKGHMGGWLANPQEIKLGAHMPAVPMDSEALIALLHYMQSLR